MCYNELNFLVFFFHTKPLFNLNRSKINRIAISYLSIKIFVIIILLDFQSHVEIILRHTGEFKNNARCAQPHDDCSQSKEAGFMIWIVVAFITYITHSQPFIYRNNSQQPTENKLYFIPTILNHCAHNQLDMKTSYQNSQCVTIYCLAIKCFPSFCPYLFITILKLNWSKFYDRVCGDNCNFGDDVLLLASG